MRFCLLVFILLFTAVSAQELKVVTEHAPPLQYIENGTVMGLTTDIVRKTLAKSKIKAEIQIYPWARAHQKALTEANTLIYSLIRTPDRENKFVWIGKILTMKLGFIHLSPNSSVKITDLEQAKQYRIGVMRNDFSHTYLKQQGFIDNTDFLLASDIPSLLNLIYANKIDIFIADLPLLKETARLESRDPSKLSYAYLLPEQEFSVYLAANVNTDSKLIQKLKTSLRDVTSTTSL